MRHDEDIRGSDGTDQERGRVGRPEFRLRTRARIALLLAAAIGLAWLPRLDPPQERLPMRRARGDSAAPIRRLAFSPDGRTIATVDQRGHVRLRPAVEGGGVERNLDVRGHGRTVAISPDGRYLAIGRDEPDVAVCDLSRGGQDRLLGIPVEMTSDLKFSPDGRTLAVSSHRSREIILWDIETGQPRMTLRGHSSPVMAMAFAPDGQSLASAAWPDRVVVLWDLDTGRPRRRLTGPSIWAPSLAYSPDGRLLATVNASERCVRIWDVRTGGQVGRIAGHSLPIHSVAFSPDGRLLATGAGDGSARLWSAATGRELRRLDGQADLLREVVFSPDGRTLAATANDGDVRLWDLADPVGE
jgi:WD40 repeat protein